MHRTGTRDEWRAARVALLQREKELTKLSDELAAARQDLPWVPLEKEYEFETPDGPQTLAELFAGRSQLIVYHFMLPPGATQGCRGCSAIADQIEANWPHLHGHDVTMTVVSRASLADIDAYRTRMGWTFPWVSSGGTDFNYDFHVSHSAERPLTEYNFAPADFEMTDEGELPGMSAFALVDGVVHHTYSAYSRGMDVLWGTYQWLDRAPLGRNEDGLDWLRRHDEYEAAVA